MWRIPMKHFIAATALFILAGCATKTAPKPQPPAAPTIADIVANPASFSDKEVSVEGTVTQVCQGMGCWIEISDGKNCIIAKSLDHTVLFPKDCVQKKALVKGIVKIDPPQECKEHGEGKPDHECPKPAYLISVITGEVK